MPVCPTSILLTYKIHFVFIIYIFDKKIIYSTVPYYLRSVAAIHARHSGDVYFVTYDQFAKVAKIDQQHFCSRICDAHYGYIYK